MSVKMKHNQDSLYEECRKMYCKQEFFWVQARSSWIFTFYSRKGYKFSVRVRSLKSVGGTPTQRIKFQSRHLPQTLVTLCLLWLSYFEFLFRCFVLTICTAKKCCYFSDFMKYARHTFSNFHQHLLAEWPWKLIFCNCFGNDLNALRMKWVFDWERSQVSGFMMFYP